MKDEDYAFPQQRGIDGVYLATGGVTKREYLSAMILSGMASTQHTDYIGRDMVNNAINVADLLIETLEKLENKDGQRKT